jgi:hypothetical protein
MASNASTVIRDADDRQRFRREPMATTLASGSVPQTKSAHRCMTFRRRSTISARL